MDTLSIEGLFAGQSFTYFDMRESGDIELGLNIEDADAFFAGIQDIDSNATLSDDDLRFYEAILEGTPASLTISEDNGLAQFVIGDDAIIIDYDDTTGTGTVTIPSLGRTDTFSRDGNQSADEAILSALEATTDDIEDDNGELSRFLSLFTPSSIANTYDDPIAGNPGSVVGRMPGILRDIHTRQLPSGKKMAFFGKVEAEAIDYDDSGDASIISGQLAGVFAAGPGEFSVTVPLAYTDYDTGEEVGHVGLILGYGWTMNDYMADLPFEWTSSATIGAVGGTSDALVDTALVSTFGFTNRFMTDYSEKIRYGAELDLQYFGSPDIEFDDYTQTYDISITGITVGGLFGYTLDTANYSYDFDFALRRTQFEGEDLAIDAQNELEALVGGNERLQGGLTFGFGEDYKSIAANLKWRF